MDTTWNINAQLSGTIITLGYDTQFEQGRTERFIFRIEDGKALLIRYDVYSPSLKTI
jgi:hypothetical protein